LAEMKGGRKITIGLEGHANTLIEKPGPAIELMRGLWPAVGYVYDPSHPELQDVPLADTEPLLEYTCHVHVRNASTGKMQDTMETGTVDFAWVIDALKRAGYDGAVAIEYFSNFDPEFKSVMALRDRLVELGLDAKPG
ncbi:MAG TPA: sugar phosphate isomerase/epimerase, partial [Armatimonadota bacterium]|nr:sugar phosphate isomerase/epimerase [Armatimonadota bacterium]